MENTMVANITANAGQGTQATTPADIKTASPNITMPTGKNGENVKPDAKADADVQKAIEKVKLVIDGNEEELSLDDVKALAQKGKASDKRFQEAAKLRKQSEDLIRLLKSDPLRVLSHPMLGHDVRKLAEEFLYQRIQEENMDPKDKELLETKRKLQEYEDQQKLSKQQEEEKQNAALKAKYEDEYSKDIIQTLETSGLPKSPRTVARIAYYMHQGLLRGVDLKATDVIDLVKQDYMQDIKELLGPLDGEILLGLLGEDVAKKVRSFDMSRLKKPGTPIPSKEQPAGTGESRTKKHMTIEEWKERNRRMMEEG